MSEERIESFLGRWSRLKQAEKQDEASRASTDAPTDQVRTGAELEGEPAAVTADQRGEGPEGQSQQPVKDYSDFDFESLRYESDYEQFMDANVPDDVRNTALRKLWRSNPVLANVDGLDDYCEDYTDAAMCLPKGTMKTAYRFGRGFLSDAEVAKWEALGKPVDAAIDEGESEGVPVAGEPTHDDAASAEEFTALARTSLDDWPESAATTGAGCAAALKSVERDAPAEDADEVVSGENRPEPGPTAPPSRE